MEDIFIKTDNCRRTRISDDTKLFIPYRIHEYGKNCLSYLGATIWNNIDSAIKQVKTCTNFKHKIKEEFFKHIKQRENDIYIY